MPETYYIYTLDDIDTFGSNPLVAGDLATVASSASPDYIHVSDGDTVLDVLASADADQILAEDLVIDGTTVGTAGQAVSVGWSAGVENFTANTGGIFSAIVVDGNVVGFVSTMELTPGDALSITSYDGAYPVDYEDLVACFTRDTKILCERGEVAVQDVREGDLVVTRNTGLQPIRWVGGQKTSGRAAQAPIRFKAGALGNETDIVVSPMHRMLVSGPRAEVLFGVPSLLAYAKDLCDGDSIYAEPVEQVEYFHILFDDHQLISAHGCWSESFAPHREAVDAFSAQSREEILKLFPQLDADWQDALPTLSSAEAAMLLSAKH